MLAVCILIVVLLCTYQAIQKAQYQNKGQILIDTIEQYYISNSMLPQNMGEIGMADDEGMGPFYLRESDSTYVVYFCLGFDEYYIYESTTKQWRYSP